MSKERSTERDNEDPRKAAISRNPCSICRASGSPVCKGHGGGAGGGSSDDTKQQKEDSQIQSGAMPLSASSLKPQSNSILNLLEKSQLWTQSDELVFQYKNPFALYSMTISMDSNTLTCHGHDDLTPEEQHAMEEVFKAIRQELESLKQEFPETRPLQANINRVGNQMTIAIPNQKRFDAFIQRLVDKNLLNLVDKNLLTIQPGLEQKTDKIHSEVEALKSEQSASSFTAPNPFDLTPKPK